MRVQITWRLKPGERAPEIKGPDGIVRCAITVTPDVAVAVIDAASVIALDWEPGEVKRMMV